jgi:hypothetical protein
MTVLKVKAENVRGIPRVAKSCRKVKRYKKKVEMRVFVNGRVLHSVTSECRVRLIKSDRERDSDEIMSFTMGHGLPLHARNVLVLAERRS